MASGGSDDSHWDLDRSYDRDLQREPVRCTRRAPVQLSMHGTLKEYFTGREPRGSSTAVIDQVGDRCYACDARAVGTRDRRPEGGQLERACARHADGAR